MPTHKNKYHISLTAEVWEMTKKKAENLGQTISQFLEDLLIRRGLTDEWQGYDPLYKLKNQAPKAETSTKPKAAENGAKPERKRQRQKPNNSTNWGTYEEGQAEAREAFPQAKAHGRTLEEVQERNAAIFDERGEEWRRGFADQFQKLEAEAEKAEALKEAAAIESRTRTAKTGKTKKPTKAKPTDKDKKTTAREYREQGLKRGAKRNHNRELLAPSDFTDEETKAEAEALREKAAREAAELKAKTEAENREANAEIDRKIKALRADYQAGRISAAEYDRREKELQDERPF